MAGISSLGVGSNLNLSALLDQLVSAEKKPQQDVIDSNTALTKATISALGTVKSKLAAFQDSLAKLKDPTFYDSRSAKSSDETLFTVSATNKAQAGSYAIEVLNLAKANKIASANFTSASTTVGNGTLTVGVGGTTFDVAITAGVNDTVAGVRDAINNAANNTGVKASLLTVSDGVGGTATKLVLTANNTGASSQISLSVADGDGNNTDNTGLSRLYYDKNDVNSQLSQVNAATDAKITVDGFPATSSTNAFTDVVEGVTITALKSGTDINNPLSGDLTVSTDTNTIKSNIQKFVDSYNDLVKTLTKFTKPVSGDPNSGALSGDSSLRAIQTQLRSLVSNTVGGSPTDFNSLAFLGITTSQDGTLTINATKETAALTNRLDDVANLFSSGDGVAKRLDTTISSIVNSGGVLQTREQTLNDRLKKLGDQQIALDKRIDDFTTRYQKQFTSLDTLVSQLNKTGDFLTQQLDAASKIITRKST